MKIALDVPPMLKDTNIHHQESSSKCRPSLNWAWLTGILTFGNFPIRDAKHIKEGYWFF